MHTTKLQQLRDHMAAGRYTQALKLAASWGRRGLGGGAQAEAITKGHAAQTNGAFYRELGQNPETLVQQALQAIRDRYQC